jgi:hypothetical protein
MITRGDPPKMGAFGLSQGAAAPPPAPFGLEFSWLIDIAVATLVPQVLGGFNVLKRRFAPSIWGSSTFPRTPPPLHL